MEKQYSVQSILFPSLNSNLDGISADIFFRGCTGPHCQGCHNLELQTFIEPNKSVDEIVCALKPYEDEFYVITLMGGEPMDIDKNLLIQLLSQLKSEFPQKKLSMYTRTSFRDMSEYPEVLKRLDYVKCGRYIENNRTPFGSFLASKNQIMYYRQTNCRNDWSIQWQYK